MSRRILSVALVLLLVGCGGGGAGGPRPAIDLTGVVPAAESFEDDDLDHLQYVLSEAQQQEYRVLSPGDRAEFLGVVWAALDPTPTTPGNERKLAHYRRLAYAREHFAIDEAPGWDQRGELLLRYGPPDRRETIPADVVEGLGLVPAKEVWLYTRLGQAYRLEDPQFQGNFRDFFDLAGTRDPISPRDIEASRDQLEDARDLPAMLFTERIDLDALDAAEEQLALQRLEAMLTRGQQAYKEKPQAYFHDYGGGKLDFVFDVVNFSAGDGKTRIEINTAYWANDLEYMAEGEGYVAVLGTQVAVKTMDYRSVLTRGQVTRDPKDSIENLEGRLVLDQVRLDLDPGPYRLALSVRDSLSGNVGIYTTEMEVASFSPDRLSLSDIQLALDVRSGQPGDPFLKGDLQVVPYPLGTFPRDRDIYLYFEIYGLELSPSGDTLYSVEFLIRPRTRSTASWFGSSKGKVVPGVATTFEGRGFSPTAREYIILDPVTFREDVYDVEITVHDRVGDRTTSRSVSFGVET